MQKDGVLVPYITSKGHSIALLRHGILTVPEMFDAEHSDVRWMTWKLRGCGVFLLYASSVCLAKLLRIFCKKPLICSYFFDLNEMVYSCRCCSFTKSTLRWCNIHGKFDSIIFIGVVCNCCCMDILQTCVGCRFADGLSEPFFVQCYGAVQHCSKQQWVL